MRRNVRVKPGKGQSMVGFVFGIIFCFIGLFVVIPTFSPFGAFWTLAAVVITIMNGYNAFTNKGIVSHEITIEEDNSYSHVNLEYGKTSEQRLNELQELFKKEMITYDEYQEKRKQILEEL